MNVEKKKKMARRLKEAPLHAMMVLPVLVLFIFHYIPLFGIIIAFQKYNPAKGIIGSPFVGFDNFKNLFYTPGFLDSVRNTVIIALGKIILGLIVPITIAFLLNEMRNIRVKRIIQTTIYLPHFVSWVLMAGIVIEMLNPSNGIVNKFLSLFGIDPILFLGSNKWFRPVIWITDIWKEFGYATIIYLAALTGVNANLYEAASLDGAGYFKKAIHVTLPSVMPTIILMATLKMGSILNAGFDHIFNLYSPVTMETGDIIDTLVYRIGINNAQFSIATAASMFKSIISGFFLVLSYKISYKVSGYSVF